VEREKSVDFRAVRGAKKFENLFFRGWCRKIGCKLVARKAELVYTAAKTGKSQRVDSSHLECLTYALYRLKEEEATRTVFFREPIFQDRLSPLNHCEQLSS